MAEHDTITYGEHSLALSKLPPVSLHRLASYGLSHLLGNQMSSKVVAWSDKDENKDATDEAKATVKAEFQAKAIASLMDGTIGQHAARGPSVDPVEAEMARIAKTQVVTVLKANGTKVPKKDEAVEFADGSKFTMGQLVERRLANPKFTDAIKKEAEASLKAKAKAKAKLVEQAGNTADL